MQLLQGSDEKKTDLQVSQGIELKDFELGSFW